MSAQIKKFVVRLNNNDKIEQLLQETYNQACKQYNAIQEEINKIVSTTKLNDLDIEGKERYGKIMSNYITLMQKAISQKFDIAKLLSEIVKYSGDVKEALESNKQITSINIAKLKEIAKSASSNEKTEVYKINK